jgi:hypothetical protein
MAYNQYSCSVEDWQNTGYDKCNTNLGAVAMIILTADDYEITTEALAKTLATWTQGIQERNVFPLPRVWSATDQSEKDIYETSPLGQKKLGKEGTYGGEYLLDAPLGMQVALRSFNGADLRVFYVDVNGNILGMSIDGTKFRGYKVGMFHCEGMNNPVAKEESRKIVVNVWEDTPTDRDDYGVMVTPTAFNPIELEGLKDVNLTIIGTPTDSSIVVDVKTAYGQVGLSGLVTADFLEETALGVDHTISSATESATIAGRYTLASSAAFVTLDVLDLIPTGYPVGSGKLSIAGYQSTGSVVVTIP